MLSSLKKLTSVKRAPQGNVAKRDDHAGSKVWGTQIVREINLWCESLSRKVGVDPVSLPDSQVLDFNSGLNHLDNGASKILDKITEYFRYAVDLGPTEQLQDLNVTLERTLEEKEDFVTARRREIRVRDLS